MTQDLRLVLTTTILSAVLTACVADEGQTEVPPLVDQPTATATGTRPAFTPPSDTLIALDQQVRMRDGVRRITHIMEVIGMEESTIVCQDLFWYEFTGEGEDGKLQGNYVSSGLRPHFMKQAEMYGLQKQLLEVMAV